MLRTAPHEQESHPVQDELHIDQSSGSLSRSSVSKSITPLRPSSASEINARRNVFLSPRSQCAKRTHSGLSKLTAGSFDEEARPTGSNTRISVTTGKGSAKITETIIIDENDFESDVELDCELPRPAVVSYPVLPTVAKPSTPRNAFVSAAKTAGLSRPIVSPTKPRQQQMQTSYDAILDSETPFSSAQIPWSSSPAHHLQPMSATSAKAAACPPVHGSAPITNQNAISTSRKLPWMNDTSGTSTATIVLDKDLATTVPKPNKKAADLWNHTANSVKEQQKKHREETRKVVKKVEGTEESLRAAKSARKRVPKLFLSEEQQQVLDLVVEHKQSVFFTGSAGTGKSVLLREIITAFKKKYAKEPDRVAVTASTGLAACNVGGVTLHSFSGIGLGKEDVPELVKKIKRNQKARHRWLRAKVLIIDEVSMVDGDLFDKLEAVARQLRNNGRPFGGIQLVITGDFFQLPPVPDSGRVAKFSFDAATWPTVIEHVIGLHQVFRQKDPIFAGMLNEMREGRLSESSIKAFRSLDRDPDYKDALVATELFPLRTEVDRANAERLDKLHGHTFVFESRDGGAVSDKVQRDKLLANCMAPETIVLKKGAQVMLIKNIDETLVNGSIGKVIAFMDETQFDKYNLNEELYAQMQDDDGVFVSQTDQDSKEERAKKRLLDNITTSRQYPLVRFSTPDGNSRDMLCQPEVWKVELPNGEVQASRSQIPLILSWALSIHKAQGQTLERVKVDLGKVFEKGQAYVALSRATSMAGLQVLRFDPRKVNAHERVIKFYSALAKVELSGAKQLKPEKKATSNATEYERQFLEDCSNV